MKDAAYIRFNRDGFRLPGLSKGMPTLKAGEYAVKLFLEVPDSVFHRAVPEVYIEVPEGQVIEPTVTLAEEPPPEEVEDD